MRLWHTFFAVFLFAIVLTVAKMPAGRVAIVVFITGVGELIFGLAALMLLFQSIGSLGEAEGLIDSVQSMVATVVIVAVASYLMVGLLTIGSAMVERVV